MAVLKNIGLAALLLAPLTMAAPRLDVRAMYTHTDTEIVWVTVEETTTIFLEPGAPTPAPASVAAADTTTVAVADSSTISGPAVFAQTAYSPSTLATVAGAAPAPPSSSSTTTPAAAAWSSAPAPVAPAPAAESSPAAPAAPAPAPSASSANSGTRDISASDSATCEGTGAACVGDVTHWDGGKSCQILVSVNAVLTCNVQALVHAAGT